MNKSARRHLLDRLAFASRPRFVATLPDAAPAFNEALAEVIRGLGERESLILPPSARIEIVRPRNAPRVVAGKGKRRRGVEREPVRLFFGGRPPPPLPAGSWSNTLGGPRADA